MARSSEHPSTVDDDLDTEAHRLATNENETMVEEEIEPEGDVPRPGGNDDE